MLIYLQQSVRFCVYVSRCVYLWGFLCYLFNGLFFFFFFFQVISSSCFEPITFGQTMTSFFVLNLTILLCPFHKELIIWENMSFGFGQTYINSIFHFIVYSFIHRQLTRKNLQVSEFSSLHKLTKRTFPVFPLEISTTISS